MSPNKLKYEKMIGVGGIGSGSFFLLNGNNTLGREESRSGRLLERKDYCKLHIISHYVKVLLGKDFQVFPIGKVGKDKLGEQLLNEMKEIGLSMEYVGVDPAKPTLYSFCFLYPDRGGSNLTIDNSACSNIDDEFILQAEKELRKSAGKGIALAVPEVPVSARIKLLDLASEYEFYSVASFTSEEIKGVINSRILGKVDLLCINLEEAASALNINIENHVDETISKAIKLFTSLNPQIFVSITNGKFGSYIWDGHEQTYMPAFEVDPISTAGAGDAFTAGLITGIANGLSLKESLQIGTLIASCSVISPDTINKKIDIKALLKFTEQNKYPFSSKVLEILMENQ